MSFFHSSKPETRILLAACLLVLAACNTNSTAPGGGKVSSEDLLDSEGGRWSMVEQESEMSPLQMHEKARKVVNPADLQKHMPSGSHFKPHQENEDMRVLKLVRGDRGDDDAADFMPADTELMMEETEVAVTEKAGAPVPGHKPQMQSETELADLIVPAQKPAKKEIIVVSADRPIIEEPEFEQVPGEQEEEPAPIAVSGDGVEIADVRFGDHPGKTRMVLDLTGPVQFEHKLDNEQHLLAIEIRGAQWNAGTESKIIEHSLVAGYKAYAVDGATRIALRLKKPVKVVWSAALKPDHGKSDRLVFDIAAL
jgi:hypothetical protein